MKQMSLQFTAPERSEGNLQPRERQQVGHHGAGQDSIQGRMREAGARRHSAHAGAVVDDAPQREREQSDSFVLGLVEGRVGPVGREFSGLHSDLSRHGMSVRDGEPLARRARAGYNYSHHEFVDAYTPRMPVARWEPIAS